MKWSNLDIENVGTNLTVYQAQQTDDGIVGSSLIVTVQALHAYNVNVTVQVGKEFELEYKPYIYAREGCGMEVSCWSVECTDQLKYAENKWKITASAWNAITHKNSTFVYLLDYKCPNSRELKTFTFKTVILHPGIIIFAPSKYMYRYFRDSLRFKMIEPYGYNSLQ